ncbi:ankyrin repeat domain-containing protein [Luteimonas sp. SJ-92]|uniref:Ankyrin repeat domain-containing protein n=1 Tax=Luteimonas salinisoli TaxID=2752307 RepID=A0A853JAB5_9GAMM|nr:ankyrin repeat domain-containing protein [Luteimonas salinisoli]
MDANEVFADPRAAELAAAVAAGDAAAVRALAQAGAPLDAQGDKQVTLLQWALLNKSPRGMEALLDAGADPAQPGIDGDTVIHLAAMANDAQYLELLLARGADPGARNAVTQATPLASALRGKREAQLQALLDAGADPNAADRGGNTPLHQAAKYNDPVNALKLLEAGADPNARNVQDVTFQRFLFTTREDVLSGEAKRGRERIRDWLRAHDVAIEDPAGG